MISATHQDIRAGPEVHASRHAIIDGVAVHDHRHIFFDTGDGDRVERINHIDAAEAIHGFSYEPFALGLVREIQRMD